MQQIKAQKAKEKKDAAEEKRKKEKARGKRPVEKPDDDEESQFSSPPISPPPKQISKSLMIQNNTSRSNHLSQIFRDYSREILPKISVARRESEMTPVPDFDPIPNEEDSISFSGTDESESIETQSNPFSQEEIDDNQSDLPEVMATPGVKVEEPSDEDMTEAEP